MKELPSVEAEHRAAELFEKDLVTPRDSIGTAA